MISERYVGLVRVSTQRQGESGLGLEAGLHDLHQYITTRGATLLHTFEEIESGTHDDLIDRPVLIKALTLCKRSKATLLIPKVDRLVRSTCVHTDIKRSGIPFRACDNPEANELTLDLLVAVAAQEGRQISDRTKKALAAYKAGMRLSKRTLAMYPNGVPADVVLATAGKLGSHLIGCRLTDAGRDKGRSKANAKQRREAVDVYADLVEDVGLWRAGGLSLQDIADRLNDMGHTTRTGCQWSRVQVSRLLKRSLVVG